MKLVLRSVVRDCLYLNWAVPRERLPAPPEPLKLEEHEWEGTTYGFVSALLFRQERLRISGLPVLRISHPQVNLRVYVRDEEGTPAVLFLALLVPAWVAPFAALAARRPVETASFQLPEIRDEGPWDWHADHHGILSVRGRKGAPLRGVGPLTGEWSRVVRYFRDRERGYLVNKRGLRQIAAVQPATEVWPVEADVTRDDLVTRFLVGSAAPLGRPHSAWLCPEMPFVFELLDVPEPALSQQVPAPG